MSTTSESRDRAALLNEIGHLKNLNERIGKDALNLTNALKGDVKTAGRLGRSDPGADIWRRRDWKRGGPTRPR